MAKKDSLETFIKKSQKGDKDAYRKIIELLYDEIYNLAAFIYEDDVKREKVTKHLFIKAYKNISEFDPQECDIHLWMAREATKELYRLESSDEDESIFSDEIEQKEYEFTSIEEDDELGEASAEFNEGFLTDTGFDADEDCFAAMTVGEKLIYLMYCYESYTIDEIEDITQIDSAFISSEIAGMREGVLTAYAPIKEQIALESEDALDDVVANDGDSDDGIDILGDPDESDYYESLDDDGEVTRRKPVRSRSKEKQYAIGSLRLTEKQLKAGIIGAAALVVLIVVIFVVMLVSAHNRSNANNVTTPAASTTAKTTETPTQASTEAETTTEEETTTRRATTSGTTPAVEIKPATEAPTTTAASTETTAAPTEATTTTTSLEDAIKKAEEAQKKAEEAKKKAEEEEKKKAEEEAKKKAEEDKKKADEEDKDKADTGDSGSGSGSNTGNDTNANANANAANAN